MLIFQTIHPNTRNVSEVFRRLQIYRWKGAAMLTLKPLNRDDLYAEWNFLTNLPANENGFENRCCGVSWEEFRSVTYPKLQAFSRGIGLPDGYVPVTDYFLWAGGEIAGLFHFRHYLTKALADGVGHIGYGIAERFRGRGYAKAGLRLMLAEAAEKVPEDEIYMSADCSNIASLKTQLSCGAQIHHWDREKFYTRISKAAALRLAQTKTGAAGDIKAAAGAAGAYSRLPVEDYSDFGQAAVINPQDICPPLAGMPRVIVSCFAAETFSRMLEYAGGGDIIAAPEDANGSYPLYKTVYHGHEIGLIRMIVGAADAGGLADELYAMGAEKIILFGTCGVLDGSIDDCGVIIPDSAVRDEGFSFHYQPASREIEVNPDYREKFCTLLEEAGIKYVTGKTWTTDTIYRETAEAVKKRREEDCICVEMECASLAAVARLRGKDFFEFFYAADVVSHEAWEPRSFANSARLDDKHRIAVIALEFAVRIS